MNLLLHFTNTRARDRTSVDEMRAASLFNFSDSKILLNLKGKRRRPTSMANARPMTI
jgi:hypothetical protein